MAKMCCFSVFSPVSDDEIKSKVIKYLSDVDAAYNTDASFAIIYDKRTTTDRQFICFSNETMKTHPQIPEQMVEISSNGGGGTYTTLTPTNIQVGGVPTGTNYNNTPIANVIDQMLHTYLAPSFSSFSIANNALEVGQTFSTPASFSWAMSNSNNANLNTLSLAFNGQNIPLANKTANGNITAEITPVTKYTTGTVTAVIVCQNTKGNNFNRSASVSWSHRIYTGISTSDTMTADNAKTLAKTRLASNINGTHTFTGSGYEYIIYPAVWNSPTSVKDPGGFNFAYIHLPNITIINNYGVSIEYKVLRSKNFLNTPTSMIIA